MITYEEAKETWNYDPDTGVMKWKIKPATNIKLGDITGALDSHGYLVTRRHYKIYQTHRLIWLLIYKKWPNEIDHINGIRNE